MNLTATRFLFSKSVFYVFALLISIGFQGLQAVNAQTTLISPTGDGGFENGTTFSANGWTVVNGATNQWFVGSVATPSAGSNSAYISDNSTGTTYNYNNTSASSIVHFYRDVTFPAGETNIVLSFKWKAQGEGNYDYVTVYSMPTSVTPVVNTPSAGSQNWLNIPTSYSGAVVHSNPPNLNLQSAYQTQTICLPSSYAGTSRRLVFMWSNDGSGGSQPPGSVDEISLVTTAPAAPASSATGLSLTAFTGSINGSFTAAAGSPDGYLVVRYPAGATPVNPVNGTTYIAGATLGTGRVISQGTALTFSATGLTPATAYDFYIYSYSNYACLGPSYKTASPLFGTQTTLSCTGPSGTFSVGPTGTYSTLTAAIAAMSGGVSGNVVFELQSTYTSSGETFPLTFPSNGCIGATRTVTVRPQTGATGLSITSSNTTATIDLNGATYIIIDGRPGGTGTTSQLAISNTSTGSGAAIRLINDAANNIITYCSLTASTTSTGVISFGTGIITGNDNNTISNNDIGPAGTNLPLNGIYSSGTSASVDNSNNTVNTNNILDVFSAGSVFNAINIITGNSGWTITNNKIYQTASRTVTTGNLNNGIFISSGNGYTISGNVIGYASSAATGVMSLNAAVALRYTAINAGFTAGPPASNIQGNTIAAITISTSSATTTANGNLCGINVTSGDANIGTVTGNTIGAASGTGSLNLTSTTTGALLAGINISSTGIISIQNNTMGAWNNSSTTASIAGSITGINVSGIAFTLTISNNTIGNTITDNMQAGINGTTTGSSLVSGINLSSTPTGIIAISNNTIRNLSSYGTGTSGFVRGIWTAAASGSLTIYNINNNNINNLTTNAPNTSISNGQASAVGIDLATGNNSVVSQNTIFNISNSNTGTTQFFVAGITHGNATSTLISRNRIYGLANAGTSTTTTTPDIAAGIIVRSGTTAVTIVNNMISLGNGQTSNTAFLGIQCNHGSTPDPTNNIYFNSINVEGTVSSGAQPSFGIARTDFSTTARTAPVIVKNNIITNTRSGGAGKHYAIANNYGATATATGWPAGASNYNVLNAATGTVGYWSADLTFAGWKTASGSDANSLSGITVTYVNTSTADLHLNFGTTPTQIESGGVAGTGITTDYDNQTRPGPGGSVNGGGCLPDIGADEFDGVILDLSPPVITYTALGNSSCATGRSVTGVAITDCGGINVATGTKPRLYYKKSTDANTYAGNTSSDNGWKYVEASNTSSPFSFTINYSLLQSAVATGDVIQYFVVAQDLVSTPNVAINSGIFAATPSGVALTAAAFPLTGTINSYTIIVTGLSGTITIGAAGTYSTLTGATGLFNAINTAGLTGNLTATIIDASVTESGTIALNSMANAGCNAGPVTLTIKPQASLTATLTGNNATALIKLNGADNVTIDGSNNGTSSQNLTITNTNTSTSGTVIWLASTTAGDGATNNVIKNCIVTGNASTTTLACIISSGSGLGSAAEGPNTNNTYQNNTMSLAQYAIGLVGPATMESGAVVSNNNMGTATNAIGFRSLFISNQSGTQVTGNNIQNLVTSGSPAAAVLLAGNTDAVNISANTISNINSTASASGVSSISAISITGPTQTNTTINGNTITGVQSSITSGGGVRGIIVQGNGTTVSNNMLSDIYNYQDASATSFATTGISIDGTITDVKVYHNSINLYGSHPGLTATAGVATCLYINSIAVGGLDIRNNIFSNSYDNSTSTGDKSYAIYSVSPNNVFSNINNNDYYVSGTGSPVLGFLGNDLTTLPALQAAFGGNTNSINFSPVYVSATNLHLSNALGANWCLNSTGTVIPGITTDIDLQARSTPPDMGADEFTPTDNSIATPSTQTICSGNAATTIVLSGIASSFTWTRDNTAGATGIAASGTGNISGSLTNTTTAPVTVTFTITPLNAVGCPLGSTITATVVVNPNPNAVATPSSQIVCTGSGITAIVNSSSVAGTVYNWTRDNTATVTGIAASGTGNISGTLTSSTTTPVTVTFTITPSYTNASITCTGTPITATVTVNPANTATLTSATGTNAQTVCINNAITNITYATIGATGATFSGLPAGVSGVWAANVVTISGTPTASGTFNYTVTQTGGCPVTTTGSITVTPDNTITLTSAPGTISQSICANTAITNITYATNGATGATVTGLPAGVSGSWAGNVVTISGTPTISGTYNYTVTLTGGCGTVTTTGTISVTNANTIILTSATGTNAQTLCINNAITNITYTTTGATGATVTGLPAGVSGVWAANVVTISGTPTASGTFNYTVTPTGGCGGSVTATGSVTVTPNNTITLSSAAGTNAQAPCINTAITNITYATTGATGATVTGLPTGVTGSFAANTVTISGTPTVSGAFNYTVTLTGGCSTVTATGSISVTPNNAIALTSAAGTNVQALCINTAITNITYATISATGATFTGLPAGVSGTWAANTVTISGSPTVSGTFNYTVTLTGGGCGGVVTATGTITVTPNNTITLSSAAGTNVQNRCINTAITTITYTSTGATGATFTGLPASVSGTWAANVVTISGTPTAAGTFNYTVTLTGGCATVTATGSITVAPVNTVALSSAAGTDAQTLCINNAITSITYATTGATGVTVTGLPAGISGVFAANTLTISGSPTVSGTFNYTVTLTGGCTTVTATGSIVVIPNNTITLASGAGTNVQTRCMNSAITTISYGVTGSTGATFTGLPAGVSGSYTGSTATISGTPTASGVFSYTVALTGGCGTVAATGTITVNPLPTVNISPATATICTGSSITLTASGASTYSWSPATGLSASTGTSVVASPTATITYNVTGTDANGCVSTASRLVTVNSLPAISITPTGPITICQGLSTTLTATGAVSYSWSPATGLSSTTGSSVTATPASTTTYTVTGTNINGCINTATKTVTVLPAPDATITPAGYTNICQDDTVFFTAKPGYASYVWMLYGVPVQTGVNNNFLTFTGGFYTLKVTDAGGCTATTSAPSVVTIAPRPSPGITKVGGATLDAGAGFSSYQWYIGGVMISGATSRTYTATAGGSYTVAVTDTTALHCPGKSEPYIFTGLGVNGNNNNIGDAIKLYPNPTNDIVHIDAPVSVNVIVSSMDGKLLFYGNDIREVNIGAYADGLYRILITDKNGVYLKIDKITKMTR